MANQVVIGSHMFSTQDAAEEYTSHCAGPFAAIATANSRATTHGEAVQGVRALLSTAGNRERGGTGSAY